MVYQGSNSAVLALSVCFRIRKTEGPGMVNRLRFYLLVLWACTLGYVDTQSLAADNPNIVLVMADDLGIGDISPTNPKCKIATPRLQQLANNGLTFFDAHSTSSVCTPTRYGLLTGRYNWRSRLSRGVLNGRSDHLIPAERATLGHLLRESGYHTAMIGKWHLGWDWYKEDKDIDFTKPVVNGPDINGFDYYYGHCGSLDMPPYVWVDTGQVTAVPDREEGVTSQEDAYGWYREGPIGSDFHIPEVLPHLFDKSIEYVTRHSEDAKKGKPFFLYLPLPAPHTPIVPVAPFRDASGINPYADFVMQVDHLMGSLLDCLSEQGLEQNTLVIFTSDNGCSPQANFEILEEHGHDPSGIYRGHKADIFEGGHRVPLIVKWPEHIQAGTVSRGLTCHTDVYATLEEIVGNVGESGGGEDGFSLVPIFNGKQSSARTGLVSHSIDGSFAIREGDWKLCLCYGSGGWSKPKEKQAKADGLAPLQLFNLSKDVSETENVAEFHPEKVTALLQLLDDWVQNGRSTPGRQLANDREVTYLPKGVTLPKAN